MTQKDNHHASWSDRSSYFYYTMQHEETAIKHLHYWVGKVCFCLSMA
jgi:hypothetical protein